MDDGSNNSNYLNYSNITQKIGVYTSHDYASIIDHLVHFWNIDKLENLNEEGKKGQDFLSNLSSRYYKLADRIQEPEEVQLIWLK